MSNRPDLPPDDEAFERDVRETAQQFAYPPTPDIAASVRGRLNAPRASVPTRVGRAAAAAAIVLIVLGGLWSVPPIRAAVLELLRIGAVTIIVGDASPTPAPTRPSAATRDPDEPITSVLALPGETTLAAAEEQFGGAIPLPTYPDDLGAPNRVFVEEYNAPLITLVWLEPDNPERVRLALQIINSREDGVKSEPNNAVETRVNNRRALWLDEPHILIFYGRDEMPRRGADRMVEDNVLIWENAGLTWRLESRLTMDEAVRVAESVR